MPDKIPCTLCNESGQLPVTEVTDGQKKQITVTCWDCDGSGSR